ncbi:hypothetical protein D915_010194 [Fasciola hepatica]|uniref:Uncharacterized protein n=1 Tax=Fasciola hepatica TaxID=6192 RepID=A0A4E0QZP4_FASHE|nr:hypothetical protein D915_010194 [Fasciola hepatica]
MRLTIFRFRYVPPGSVAKHASQRRQIRRYLQRLREKHPLFPKQTMEQSDRYENAISAMVTTGNTSTANLIPTANEDLATSDGNAEAIGRSL